MSGLFKIIKGVLAIAAAVAAVVAVFACVKVVLQITRRKKLESYPEFVSDSFTI